MERKKELEYHGAFSHGCYRDCDTIADFHEYIRGPEESERIG
jgi:hypothetical protein